MTERGHRIEAERIVDQRSEGSEELEGFRDRIHRSIELKQQWREEQVRTFESRLLLVSCLNDLINTS